MTSILYVRDWTWSDKIHFIRILWNNQAYATAVTGGQSFTLLDSSVLLPQLTDDDIESGLKSGHFHYLQGKCFKLDVQSSRWDFKYYDEFAIHYGVLKIAQQLYNEFLNDDISFDESSY